MSDQADSVATPSFFARHPVAVFLTLSFAISWGGVLAVTLPDGITGDPETIDKLFVPVFLAMLSGPVLSALILTAVLDGWSGFLELFRGFMRWRAKPLEYAATCLLIPACALATLLPLAAMSPDFTPGVLSSNGGLDLIVLGLVSGFAAGMIEEACWTGFAIRRLLAGRTIIAVGISFGLIHGVWHLPVTIWNGGAAYGYYFIPYFLTTWILALITLRILIVWIYARTRSTLLSAVAHASHTGSLFILWPTEAIPAQQLLWTSLFAALGLMAVLIIVFLSSKGNSSGQNSA